MQRETRKRAPIIGITGQDGSYLTELPPHFNVGSPGDRTPKLLDVSRLQEWGWQTKTPLHAGLEKTLRWCPGNCGKN